MRVLSLLGRTGLRSPRLLGSTPRALPILAVRQHLLSAHKALPPALAVPTIKHEQPNLRVLQLVAAGSVLGVLAQSYEPASCGKRKKKDTDQDDAMYEIDHIKARKYQDLVHASTKTWCPQEDGLPVLARRARQYLGRQASSAGVERMFSKAGKLYDDAKKGQDQETLD